jgi:multidrug efflux pump subunit AcrA (membrane-fusion protein)
VTEEAERIKITVGEMVTKGEYSALMDELKSRNLELEKGMNTVKRLKAQLAAIESGLFEEREAADEARAKTVESEKKRTALERRLFDAGLGKP